MSRQREADKKILQIREALFAFEEIEVGYIFGSFLEREDLEDIDVALLI